MTNTTNTHDTVALGTGGPRIFPLALGCMGMGAGSFYGDADEAEGIATIRAALDGGVNLIDTATSTPAARTSCWSARRWPAAGGIARSSA